MKLQPELVPKPLWRKSAHRLLDREDWETIRQDTLTACRNRCFACGIGGRGLECHELWAYDDRRFIVTLGRFVILCPKCHAVVHLGRAEQHGLKDVAIAQLRHVNGCSEAEADSMFKEAKKIFYHRSGFDWTMLVTEELRARYPALAVLHAKTIVNALQPSVEKAPAFLWAFASGGRRYPNPTARRGKWLLFVPRIDVDEAWRKIREALVAGKLGACAKVSTARQNVNSLDPNRHVICVYTYDSDDVSDVMRVRMSLRELGFRRILNYKTDEATKRGRYAAHGDRQIAKYRE